MFIVLERGWVRIGFHFHSFLEENIHPTDFMWHIRTAVSICQLSRHSMVRATGKGSKEINWLPAKQMPIIVCFNCAGKDGRRPIAWWMDGVLSRAYSKDYGLWNSKETWLAQWHRWRGVARLSERLLTLCANQTLLSFIVQNLCVGWKLSYSPKWPKPSP